VQVLFVYNENTVNNNESLLVELYYKEPVHLYQQVRIARGIRDVKKEELWLFSPSLNLQYDNKIKRLLDDLPACLAAAFRLP
jgi:hypothetical protein